MKPYFKPFVIGNMSINDNLKPFQKTNQHITHKLKLTHFSS